MSTTTRKDVLLVIRAKDEAERAVNAATDALRALFDMQGDVGDGAKLTGDKLRDLVGAIQAVERANNATNASWSKAEGAHARQQANLAETKAQLASVKGQIEGLNGVVANAPTTLINTKLAGGDLNDAIARINAAKAALAGLTSQESRLTASVHAQEAAIGQARNSLQQLGSIANATEAALLGVGDATQRSMLEARVATERETAALREQAQAAREAIQAQAAQNRFNSLLGVRDISSGTARRSADFFDEQMRSAEAIGRGARSIGVATFDEQRRAMEAVAAAAREAGAAEDQMTREASELRAVLNPLVVIEEKLNRELARTKDLYRAGKIEAHELAAAERLLAQNAKDVAAALSRQGRGERGRPSLFGLKPYELTNLGYQVNDVFTQLASGTSLTQTLAQQGGQLLQLFPRLGSTIVAALTNPGIVASAAAFGAIAASVSRVRTEIERIRTFDGILTSMGDGARYTAQGLADAADHLDRFGMSAEQAVATVRIFVREGINPERIEEFGRAAQNMADVLGIDVTDAARQLAEGFSGGYDALMRLQEATDFLTTEERRHITTMMEQGRTAEALTRAFEIFSQRLDQGARQARGPWTDATRHLDNSWKNLLDTLGNTAPIRTAAEELDNIAGIMDRIANATDGVRTIGEIDTEIADAEARLRRFEQSLQRGRVWGPARESLEQRIREARQAIQELRQERQRLQQQSRGTGNVVDPEADRRRRYVDETNRAIALEQRLANARTDSARIAAEGERAYWEELRRSGNEQAAQARRRAAEDSERLRQMRNRERELERERRQGITQLGSPLRGGGDPNSRYGWRTDPITGQRRFHRGDDYARPAGTPVYATGDGVVREAGMRNNGFGIQVRVDLGRGTETLFAHLARAAVRENQEVRRGELLGYVGSTGRSTGNHLHYGVYQNGQAVDPRSNGGRFPTGMADALADAERTDERRLEQQTRFNERIDQENATRRISIQQAERLLGLSGEQLFNEQRRQAVEDAVNAAQQDAARQDLELSEDRRRAIDELVGREWDLAHARERATAAVDELTTERQAILERLQQAHESGDAGMVTALEEGLRQVDQALERAIESAMTFWRQFNTPEARAALMGLANLRDGIGRSAEDMRRTNMERPFEQLQRSRAELMEQIEFFRNVGQMGVAEELREQLRGVDQQLIQAIDRLIEFWSVSTRPEAQATLLSLQNLRNTILAAQNEFSIAAGQIQQAFAGSLTNSISQWAEAIGQGRNAIGATWEMFRNFAADFLRQLAMMLLQAAALKIAMKLGFGGVAQRMNALLAAAPLVAAGTTLTVAGGTLAGAGATLAASSGTLTAAGALWATTAGALMTAAQMLIVANSMGKAGVFHGGGIAGTATRTRSVWEGVWAAAPRYHGGGFAGLRPGEVPAILERGEEILKRGDPRHMLNGGGRGDDIVEPKVDLQNVIVFDPSDVLSRAVQTRVGQRVLMTFVSNNARAIKTALG